MTEKSKTKRNHVIWSREEYLRQKAASTEKMEIHLTNNYAFHRVFKCEKVVKGFLMALLNLGEEEIVQLEISDPFVEGESQEEKQGILDIKLHLNNGQKINIEMQNRYQSDWSERSVFYNCRMFVEGFQHGKPYADLEPCVHVGILDFIQMSSPGFHHLVQLADSKTGEIYSRKFSFHVIELRKLKQKPEEADEKELHHWAKMIAAKSWEEVFMEAKGNPYREAAVEEMDKIMKDEDARYLYLREEMAKSDEASRLMTAKEEGEKDGRLLNMIFIIMRQIKKKKTLEQIADGLGESPEDIKEIYELVKNHPKKTDKEILAMMER